MAFCMSCGHQLPDNVNFCPNCGTNLNTSKASPSRKTVYDGELHKCPNCGQLLNAFVPNCPSCGYELRAAKASTTVHEFVAKLEQIEANRKANKPGLWGLMTNTLSTTDEQKINLIRSFSIPNTKEDIYEFMILASSNINTSWGISGTPYNAAKEAESNAWMAKFEQAYQKAEIILGNDPVFARLKLLYKSKKKAMRRKKWEIPLLAFGPLLLLAIVALLLGRVL